MATFVAFAAGELVVTCGAVVSAATVVNVHCTCTRGLPEVSVMPDVSVAV